MCIYHMQVSGQVKGVDLNQDSTRGICEWLVIILQLRCTIPVLEFHPSSKWNVLQVDNTVFPLRTGFIKDTIPRSTKHVLLIVLLLCKSNRILDQPHLPLVQARPIPGALHPVLSEGHAHELDAVQFCDPKPQRLHHLANLPIPALDQRHAACARPQPLHSARFRSGDQRAFFLGLSLALRHGLDDDAVLRRVVGMV